MSNRQMSVAGTFYPNRCDDIKTTIKRFDSIHETKMQPNFEPKAIISPHAGYIYSGYTANCAYKLINKSTVKRVVVIGPSHHVYFEGASVALYESYDTPCASMPINVAFSKKLIRQYHFLGFNDTIHKEHSTETQLPFIQHYFPKAEVAEIVYGEIDYKELAKVVKSVMEEPKTLLVISTDLSHFHTLEAAKRVDSICVNGIQKRDMTSLNSGCEACGLIGVKALISVAKQTQIIDYRTSYDASGDDKRVVGYLSALAQ